MSWAYWAPKSTTRTGPVPSEWYTASAYLGRGLAPRWLRWRRRRLGDLDSGNPAAVQLCDGQPGPVEFGRFTELRQVAEGGQEIAGHRLIRAVRYLDARLLGEVVQVHQPVHLDLPGAQPAGPAALNVTLLPAL